MPANRYIRGVLGALKGHPRAEELPIIRGAAKDLSSFGMGGSGGALCLAFGHIYAHPKPPAPNHERSLERPAGAPHPGVGVP